MTETAEKIMEYCKAKQMAANECLLPVPFEAEAINWPQHNRVAIQEALKELVGLGYLEERESRGFLTQAGYDYLHGLS